MVYDVIDKVGGILLQVASPASTISGGATPPPAGGSHSPYRSLNPQNQWAMEVEAFHRLVLTSSDSL